MTRGTSELATGLRVYSAVRLFLHLRVVIMRRIMATCSQIGPRDDFRYGAGLICLGLSAYLLAGLHPYNGLPYWQLKLPLICFAGLLILTGTYALPTTRRRWFGVKILIAAAAVHWMFVLPLERFWSQF